MAILHFVSKVLPGEIRRDGSLEKISERSKISRNSARQTRPIGKLDQATPATRCCSNKYSTANQAETVFSEAKRFSETGERLWRRRKDNQRCLYFAFEKKKDTPVSPTGKLDGKLLNFSFLS